MKKVRILIADDHDVVRTGLRLLLRSSPDFVVVAEAGNGEEAVRLAEKHSPDVVIMDISMPGLDGIEATKIITKQHPGVRVIILSVHEDEEYAYQALRAGACGYLLKNAGKKEIFDAVRSSLAGDRFFSKGISNLIVDGFLRRPEGHPEPKNGTAPGQQLTKRELQILEYIARGHTNREIADVLFLSFRTVNTHRANIMQKLDIHDTAGLVRHAMALGLLEQRS